MTLLGCSQKKPGKIDEVREVVIIAGYEECPRPAKPELKPLLEEMHLGSRENVDRMMHNIVELQGALKGMKATVWCYEIQADKGGK